MKNAKFDAAMDILSGKTVVGHDRRKDIAPAIPFLTGKIGKTVTIKPEHGISNAMFEALKKTATKVEFVAGKRKKTSTMPVFHFS